MHCIVVNCSDSFDNVSLTRLLGGIAASSTWICFDEFNRMSIESIHSAVNQISAIHRALTAGNHSSLKYWYTLILGQTRVCLRRDIDVALTIGCAVFVTCNVTILDPCSYVAFRTMTMIQPNAVTIVGALLRSNGFVLFERLIVDSRILNRYLSRFRLSNIIVNVYCRAEQLMHSRCHYDYCMRTMRTTVDECVTLMKQCDARNRSTTIEYDIVRRALTNTFASRLDYEVLFRLIVFASSFCCVAGFNTVRCTPRRLFVVVIEFDCRCQQFTKRRRINDCRHLSIDEIVDKFDVY